MSTHEVYSELRQPLVDGGRTPADVTRDVCTPMEGKPGWLWWLGFLIALALLGQGVAAVPSPCWGRAWRRSATCS